MFFIRSAFPTMNWTWSVLSKMRSIIIEHIFTEYYRRTRSINNKVWFNVRQRIVVRCRSKRCIYHRAPPLTTYLQYSSLIMPSSPDAENIIWLPKYPMLILMLMLIVWSPTTSHRIVPIIRSDADADADADRSIANDIATHHPDCTCLCVCLCTCVRFALRASVRA